MKHKTPWQWLAVIMFALGYISNILGWATKAWVFVVAPFLLWSVALWCVAYRPVSKRKVGHNG